MKLEILLKQMGDYMSTRANSEETKFYKPIAKFNSYENNVIAEFIKGEKEDSTTTAHLRKKYKVLRFNPDTYDNLPKNMANMKEALSSLTTKFDEQAKELGFDSIADIPGMPETVKKAVTLPHLWVDAMNVQENVYELILTYSKQVAVETGKTPHEIVASSEGRGEITKRFFPTRSDYEMYNRAQQEIGYIIINDLQDMVGESLPILKGLAKLPVVGALMSKGLGSLTGLPSREAWGEYHTLQNEHTAKRADELYGSGPAEHKIVFVDMTQ